MQHKKRHTRRGVVVPLVAVVLLMLLAFGALTIDLSLLYLTRGQLQAASDSASLAGASGLVTDEMLQLRSGATYALPASIFTRADDYGMRNLTLDDPTQVEANDIVVGYMDLDDIAAGINPAANITTFNAVRVTVRRTAGSANGPIPYMFAGVLGVSSGETLTNAAAVLDDRFVGFSPDDGPGVLIPFVISKTQYDSERMSGPDGFSYGGSVSPVGDGIPEIHLFPNAANGNGNGNGNSGGSNNGAGNFGLLNIGTPNQGVPGLANQITNGVSGADLSAEIGQSEITFADADGLPITQSITGSPGIKAGLASTVQQRVGDVVGFFVHSNVVAGGANATYTIVEVRFGRIMDVQLNGNNKRIVVQPVIYAGGGVRVDDNAPGSDGMVVKLVLVE